MTRLRFVEQDGTAHDVTAQFGYSVMEAAIWADVPRIEATCGGSISCGTCLVHVEPAWAEKLPAPSSAELELLAEHEDAMTNSRLSCQLKVVDAIDGIIFHLPNEQRAS